MKKIKKYCNVIQTTSPDLLESYESSVHLGTWGSVRNVLKEYERVSTILDFVNSYTFVVINSLVCLSVILSTLFFYSQKLNYNEVLIVIMDGTLILFLTSIYIADRVNRKFGEIQIKTECILDAFIYDLQRFFPEVKYPDFPPLYAPVLESRLIGCAYQLLVCEERTKRGRSSTKISTTKLASIIDTEVEMRKRFEDMWSSAMKFKVTNQSRKSVFQKIEVSFKPFIKL